MFRSPLFFLLVLTLLLVGGALSAQGAPDQINLALADLANQVGHTVALGELQQWLWEQNNYPDTSLGCPKADQAYAQVVTVGYKFTLKYLDVVYDYRVAADGSSVFLCSKTGAAEVTEVPGAGTVEAGGYTPPCPTVEPDKAYMHTRLTRNNQARVVPGLPNNLRSEASVSSGLVAEIPGGAIFSVIGGPECSDGLIWWQIDFDGMRGWTVEGRDGSYWIEPLPPLPLETNRPAITKDNAAGLMEISRLQGNLGTAVAFSPQTNTLGALGGLGSAGVWLYNLDKLSEPPTILEDTIVQYDLAFSPSRQLALTSGANGWYSVWDLKPTAVLARSLSLQSHQRDLVAVAVHPDGSTFATAGTGALTTAVQEQERLNAILVWDMDEVEQKMALPGHAATINALAYSPDGKLLASGSSDTTLLLWNAATGKQVAVLAHTSGVLSLAFSPDGALLAVGTSDGTAALWSVSDQSKKTVFEGHTGGVNSVAFSPDGSLLATGSEDGTVRVWDVIAGGQPLATIQTTGEAVGDVAFSPDGTFLAFASLDRTIRLWGISDAVG